MHECAQRKMQLNKAATNGTETPPTPPRKRLVQLNGFCCINRPATAATFVMRLRSIAKLAKNKKMASIGDNIGGTVDIAQKAMNIYGQPLQHPNCRIVDHSIAGFLQKESQQIQRTHITIIDTNNKDS